MCSARSKPSSASAGLPVPAETAAPCKASWYSCRACNARPKLSSAASWRQRLQRQCPVAQRVRILGRQAQRRIVACQCAVEMPQVAQGVAAVARGDGVFRLQGQRAFETGQRLVVNGPDPAAPRRGCSGRWRGGCRSPERHRSSPAHVAVRPAGAPSPATGALKFSGWARSTSS